MNDDHIIRLIEKRYEDIKHIETEQHWFLASYAVVIAGVLAFLAQNVKQVNYVIAFRILLIVSGFGLLHAFRATMALHEVQRHTKDIITSGAEEASDDNVKAWRLKWQWPNMRRWIVDKDG